MVPDPFFLGNTKNIHHMQGNGPDDQNSGGGRNDNRDDIRGNINGSQEQIRTAVNDFTGQAPFCDVLGDAQNIQRTEQDCGQHQQDNGVVTDGGSHDSLETGSTFTCIAGQAQHNHSQHGGPQRVNGGPQVHHTDEDEQALDTNSGDRSKGRHNKTQQHDQNAGKGVHICFCRFGHDTSSFITFLF